VEHLVQIDVRMQGIQVEHLVMVIRKCRIQEVEHHRSSSENGSSGSAGTSSEMNHQEGRFKWNIWCKWASGSAGSKRRTSGTNGSSEKQGQVEHLNMVNRSQER
jgi:hypothetical protein